MRNSSSASQLSDLAALLLAIDKPDPARIAKMVTERIAEQVSKLALESRNK